MLSSETNDVVRSHFFKYGKEYYPLFNPSIIIDYQIHLLSAITENSKKCAVISSLAKATVDGFKKVDNSLKAEFPGYFEYMWGNYRNSFDISGENIIKTEKSLQSLSDLLKELSEQYTDAVFKRKATDMFIRVVENIISRNSSHKEEMQIHEDVD